MEIVAGKDKIYDIVADAVVMVTFSDQKPSGELAKLDDHLDGKISQLIEQGEISGKDREFTLIHTDKIKSPRVLIMGLGKKKEFNVDKIRSISGRAARILRRIKSSHIAYSSFTGLDLDPELAAQCITEGIILGLYHFKKYVTTRKKKKPLDKVTILAKNPYEFEKIKKGIHTGRILAEATSLSRDLSNEPANVMTPAYFAKQAEKLARELNLEVEVMDKEKLEEKNMGAFLAVARGSDEPPKLVILKYKGKPEAPTIAFVGKGLTFDSGGLSLKNAESMYRMYNDCSGACSVLGAVSAIARMKLPINLIAIMPMTENMPSGKALHPGDIIASYSGKTIEILNTDAEGRLTLADGLTLAQELGAEKVIDIATLTGGCVVALGVMASGVMGNDKRLIDTIIQAGSLAGENMWQLPLFEDYFAQIHSDVADMENSGGREASACTAGKFLEQFIKDGISWAHIDIAGTAMIERERTPYLKKPYLPKEGATGVGVRTLYNVAKMISAED